MGLDQYAYKVKGDQRWEIAYWRKHANLEGYMEEVFRSRGGIGDFNCVDLKLTKTDLLELRDKHRDLPDADGFFWGETSQKKIEDTQTFIEVALQAVDEGWDIIYSSWW